MELNEVLKRATNDKQFAEELKKKAIEAAKKGIESPEWYEYMTYFNPTPESLARMRVSNIEEEIRGTTTITTITTGTTAGCTFTTTTTTTTDA